MRNFILMVVLLFCVKAFSQSFEGTIKWSIKTDITDPKLKAQMDEAQKRMSDPAMQAQMKEMQARMNDPQFKAMMENNPQMKTQMDVAMATMQGGGGIVSMMPKEFLIKIKGNNSLTKMEGGMIAMEFLAIGDKNQSYSLDRKNKTYSVMDSKAKDEKTESEVKVTKTSETTTILNHICTKYIVEITNKGNTVIQNLWATNDIKDLNYKSLSNQRFGKGQQIFYDKVDGVPLKIEMKMEGVNMNIEAIEIKKETLNAADFTLPSDFKEVPGMFH